MKRIVSLLFLLFTAGIGRASTVESIGGRLEKGAAAEVVLTLDLASEKLASLADKAGEGASHDVSALAELIRERFHYLLRLRVAGRDLAPTSIVLVVPAAGAPLPKFLSLTATWANVTQERVQVVTQTDVPYYRIELVVVDKRGEGVGSPRAPLGNPWWHKLVGAAAIGLTPLIPGGIEQIFFVLGLYFLARRGRDLVWQICFFTFAHSLTLVLAMNRIIVVTEAGRRWVETGVALSLVTVAVVCFFSKEAPGRAWLAAVVGFGLLYGFVFARALSEARGPAAIVAYAGLELRQLIVVSVAALATGAWRQRLWRGPLSRPEIAMPASVVLGLGGMVLLVQRAQSVFALSP